MRLDLKNRDARELDLGAVYGAITLIALAAARFLPLTAILPACVFRGITGIPCPACGSTRALVCLAQGDLAGSFAVNPLVSGIVIAVLAWFAFSILSRLFRLPLITLATTEPEGHLFRATAVALVAANWIYLAGHL